MKNALAPCLAAVSLAILLEIAEGLTFRCKNGKYIERSWFCDGTNDCGDDSDELYCGKHLRYFSNCPTTWSERWSFCDPLQRCYPVSWICDKYEDCPDGSDEKTCDYGIRSITEIGAMERNLTQHLLETRRQQTRSINKWDTNITKTAVALFLNNRGFFVSGNKTGKELAYELSLKLLSKLATKKSIPTTELALYINALNVACINPKDFFGMDLVAELRKRVNNSNHTNPFSFLVLCNAKDHMTVDDVLKLQQHYNAHLRPVWTDVQSMVVMALSCISSRTDIKLHEENLDTMVSKLKKKQQKNGVVDNLRTTALVVQALLAAKSYESPFDINSAIKFILQEVRRSYPSIQDIYYILPILYSKSLADVNSDHCINPLKTDQEVISNLREHPSGRIDVQISVVVGDNMEISRAWKVKVPSNYSLYQVLENIGTVEPSYKVKYSVSQGKPYVTSLSKFQDDTEKGLFWSIYTKPLSSTGSPQLIEQSPVDIQVRGTDELILWYRSVDWANDEEDSSGNR